MPYPTWKLALGHQVKNLTALCGIGILPGAALVGTPKLYQPKTPPLHFPEIFQVHVRILSPPNPRNPSDLFRTSLPAFHPTRAATFWQPPESWQTLGVPEGYLKFISISHP
jgi:hypothetical protein